MPDIIDFYNRYTVKVNGGSGVLIQPATTEYTYILTAKHNLTKSGKREDKNLLDISEINVSKKPGSKEKIKILGIYIHEDSSKDIAIIKIPLEENIELQKTECSIKDIVYLFGFPKRRESNDIPIPTDRIEHEIVLRDEKKEIYSIKPSSPVSNAEEGTINVTLGFSGGGIFKEYNEKIFIVGIENRVADKSQSGDQLCFTNIKCFDDIIEANSLAKIYPCFMNCFTHFVKKIFDFEVDAFQESEILPIKQTLTNKASELKTFIFFTPIQIKYSIGRKLLVASENEIDLDQSPIWEFFLEWLIALNISFNKNLTLEYLEQLLKKNCFKYHSSKKDWTCILLNDLATYSDYKGVQKGSKIFIATPKIPVTTRHISKDKILKNISRVPDRTLLKVDDGISDPYKFFSFYHIEYLKKDCIIDLLEDFEKSDEEKILEKLKEVYNGVFFTES